MTEPYTPTFDTGAQPQAGEPRQSVRFLRWWRRKPDPAVDSDAPPGPRTQLATQDAPPPEAIPAQSADAPPAPPADVASEPISVPAQSVTVPGRYYYLKWWQLVLMLVAVWIPAAVIGPSLFVWWTQDTSPHKTPVVFVVLVYVVACTVAGLMLAMVQDRPLVSALGIAVMTAPFAAVAAAAPVYGTYFCSHTAGRCFAGLIPY